MRIPAILKRWIDNLAAVFLVWRENQRERHVLTVAFEDRHVIVQESRPRRDITRPDVQAVQTAPSDLSRAARGSFVVLEFPASKIVARMITVPAQAEKFLSGVVRNQIERLSPWPASDVVYGFDAKASEQDAAVVDVRVLMTSRTDVDVVRQQLAAQGLSIDRIVARGSDADTAEKGAASVTMWSRLSDASRDSLEGAGRLIGIGIGVIVATSICLSLWAFISAGLVRQESEDMAARAKAVQRQFQTGRTPSTTPSMPPAERAWLSKETSISSVIVIEALSRAMPDSAHLTEFRLENATLRVMGLADDVPGLLAPLEQSGHMTGVHFFAPTTRGSDGKAFRFYIEAHVEPRNDIAEQ
jgi:general secretion pathway protein L